MRFSEAVGHTVFSTSSATTVGRVHAFVVDPGSRAVVALRLKKTRGDHDLLLWSALTAYGRDAVTVHDEAALTVAEGAVAALLGKDHDLSRKRVLTETGDDVGTVDDVDFDPETGAITMLLTSAEEIAGDRLLGIGSYAVVVRNPS